MYLDILSPCLSRMVFITEYMIIPTSLYCASCCDLGRCKHTLRSNMSPSPKTNEGRGNVAKLSAIRLPRR